jgi:predicted aldo/keto reductase-like oxidoreductase
MKQSGIPYRSLGRTGEQVSIMGLGGFHLGMPEENEAIKIIRTAVDNGVNFMDNCWDYMAGKSEIRMGKALRDGYRQKVFLMTKIDAHTGPAAVKQLEESLKRLQTDSVDLLQFHEVIRITDPEQIFSPGGSLEALLAAKKAGKIRFIGFTGHKSPDVHLKMLQTAKEHGFLFDTVQMPLNVLDAQYDSFEKKVLPVALADKIGVLAMKPMCAGNIFKSKTVTAEECLRYDMSLPVSTVITGCESLEILKKSMDVTRNFNPLSDEEHAALLAKTASAAAKGKFELYKTDTVHDGTTFHPQWLG